MHEMIISISIMYDFNLLHFPPLPSLPSQRLPFDLKRYANTCTSNYVWCFRIRKDVLKASKTSWANSSLHWKSQPIQIKTLKLFALYALCLFSEIMILPKHTCTCPTLFTDSVAGTMERNSEEWQWKHLLSLGVCPVQACIMFSGDVTVQRIKNQWGGREGLRCVWQEGGGGVGVNEAG